MIRLEQLANEYNLSTNTIRQYLSRSEYANCDMRKGNLMHFTAEHRKMLERMLHRRNLIQKGVSNNGRR